MKVTLLSHTPDPEKAVACAARLCYASVSPDQLLEGMTEQKASDFVEMLASLGHESPIEHASFTFAVEGVSRSLLAQITRHRIATFSVQSQRYVSMEDFPYVTPPAVANNPRAAALFQEAMERDRAAYDAISQALYEEAYEALLAQGLPEKQAASAARKQAGEDARFVLPNACTTQFIMTMNARSLLNFFRLRCCRRAQWEIRELAREMLRLVCEAAPTLFAAAGPACYRGSCGEGKMSCGRSGEVRAEYADIHARAEAVCRARRAAGRED